MRRRAVTRPYLSRLELVLHAVLESLAFDFHRRQHQTVADKVGGVADTFGCFEAAEKCKTIMVRVIHRTSGYHAVSAHCMTYQYR